jgi:hypothetical protein
MGAATEFELEGKRFEVKRLSVDDACKGLEVLGKALGPAAAQVIGGGSPDYGAILQALVTQAGQLSVLLGLFAPRAKFDRGSNGVMVELMTFTDEVFGGRIDLLIAFLVHSVRAEYASFLSGSVALAKLLEELGASGSPSPKAPTA